jgi:hypothetical protein
LRWIKNKTKQTRSTNSLAVLLAVDKLFADAGTAVLLLFTSDADLFSAGRSRQMCVGLE